MKLSEVTMTGLFYRYLRDLVISVWGTIVAASTVVWAASHLAPMTAARFAPAMAAARWTLAALPVAFLISTFNIYRRQDRERRAQEQRHQDDLASLLEKHHAEVAQLKTEIKRLKQPPLGAETYRFAEREFRHLNSAYKQAIRQLLVAGDATDKQMVEFISRIDYGRYPTILPSIAQCTRFVQAVQQQGHPDEERDDGLYTINPTLLPALERIVAEDQELIGTSFVYS